MKLNEPLAKHTTFRIGGPARFFVLVDQTDQLVGLLDYLSGQGIRYYVLGGGSNVLMPDHGFDGVIIKVASKNIEVDNNLIQAEAGVPLARVVSVSAQHVLTGMEWAVGIPGTVGGAAAGNAGAMGQDMSSVVDKVEVWRNGEIVALTNQDCVYDYRASQIKNSGDVVMRVWLKLKPGDKQQIMATIQVHIKQRSRRITSNPSSGCTFKNIKLADWPGNQEELEAKFKEWGKVPAGWLIEQSGCVKGMSQGGARLSNLHSNIIENSGQATQADVLTLVEEIKQKVYNKFGVWLKEEMEVID